MKSLVSWPHMNTMTDQGYKIVLTADRTLMSEYGGGIFLGFSACLPRGVIPGAIYFPLLCPSVGVDSKGRAKLAPCGTRKIESALLDHGFPRDDIIVAHPDHLNKVVGPETKVIGLTENDPLGLGPATYTFAQIFDGETYMRMKFLELLNHPLIMRYRPKIVVGGPGAWQLEDAKKLDELKIDHVVIGEGEKVVGPLFDKLVKQEDAPRIIFGDTVREDDIPRIREPTIHGVVEIARGCGRGCKFCVPTLSQHRSLPIDHILEEVEVNLRAGRQPLLHAEDVLRYNAHGAELNRRAVIDLFRAVANHHGVNNVTMSHFTLSSIVEAPDLVEEISTILGLTREKWIGPQTGIETGSPRLMKMHMGGKCMPFAHEDWPEIVVNAFEILQRNFWAPCATLIMGLPGETDEDVSQTIQLLKELRDFKSLIVPLFFVAEGGFRHKTKSFAMEHMSRLNAELFADCWRHNLRWASTLFDEYSSMFIRNRLRKYGLKIATSIMVKAIIKHSRSKFDSALLTA